MSKEKKNAEVKVVFENEKQNEVLRKEKDSWKETALVLGGI